MKKDIKIQSNVSKVKLGNSVFKKEGEKIEINKEYLKKQKLIEKKEDKKQRKKMLKDKKEKTKKIFKNIFTTIINFVKKYKRVFIILLLLILVLMIGVYVKNKKYDADNAYYKEKMEIYGFNKMYNNGEATPSQTVTKSEAIKLILSTTENIYKPTIEIQDKSYNNEDWVVYAVASNIIDNDSINSKNENNKVELKEVINYLVKSRIELLSIPLVTDLSTDASFKDLGKYDSLIQSYIKDLVSEEILENKKGNINANSKVDKGVLNKMLVKFAEKYSTILTSKDDMINISKEKAPSNINKYPFTLSNIDKGVYEIPFKVWHLNESKNPKELYSSKKEKYAQIQENAEEYLNTIINVDYQNISKDILYEKLNGLAINGVSSDELEKYIEYVKKNNIKVSGNAKAQMPTIYFDGLNYYIRVKLEFKVESSNTKENILFKDIAYLQNDGLEDNTLSNNSKTYVYEDENKVIIDLKMGTPSNIETIFVVPDSIYSYKVQ